MNTDKHEMTMGLFIKACINSTCLFRRKVFDGTTIPGKKYIFKGTTVLVDIERRRSIYF